jgi:hypothetical protein
MHMGICLYDVPNSVAAVPEHLAVVSDTVHRHQREFSCA